MRAALQLHVRNDLAKAWRPLTFNAEQAAQTFRGSDASNLRSLEALNTAPNGDRDGRRWNAVIGIRGGSHIFRVNDEISLNEKKSADTPALSNDLCEAELTIDLGDILVFDSKCLFTMRATTNLKSEFIVYGFDRQPSLMETENKFKTNLNELFEIFRRGSAYSTLKLSA